jgi:hypothetical protein
VKISNDFKGAAPYSHTYQGGRIFSDKKLPTGAPRGSNCMGGPSLPSSMNSYSNSDNKISIIPLVSQCFPVANLDGPPMPKFNIDADTSGNHSDFSSVHRCFCGYVRRKGSFQKRRGPGIPEVLLRWPTDKSVSPGYSVANAAGCARFFFTLCLYPDKNRQNFD